MGTRHTLVQRIHDQQKVAGYRAIEAVRAMIRGHINTHNEFPAEVAIPLKHFRLFERYYPEWVADFNKQNPALPPFFPQKNQNHHILFGQTAIKPKVD